MTENPQNPDENAEKPFNVGDFLKKRKRGGSEERLVSYPTRVFLDPRAVRDLGQRAERVALPLSAYLRIMLEKKFEDLSKNIKPAPLRAPIQVMYTKKLDLKIRLKAKELNITQSELLRTVFDRLLYLEEGDV